MINLLPKKNEESKATNGIKKMSRVITTIVLVLYIVGAAGYLGWTVYQSTKTVRVSAELEKLKNDVAGKATEEVLVRKLAAKSTEINSFVSSRPDIINITDLLINAPSPVSQWTFDAATNTQKIQTSASSSAQVNDLVSYLANKYSQVKLERITFAKESGWIGVVSVAGGFKK